MPLDIKTVVFINLITAGVMYMILVYYSMLQRTFPGFSEWTRSVGLFTLGWGGSPCGASSPWP